MQRALFKVTNEPRTLSVVTFDASGKELGRSELQSAAGNISLAVVPEEKWITAGDILYVNVAMVGENGITESNSDAKLNISVENGELLGFGSAKPNPQEDYPTDSCTSYYGQAQAIVRGVKAGMMKITITDDKGREAVTEVMIRE